MAEIAASSEVHARDQARQSVGAVTWIGRLLVAAALIALVVVIGRALILFVDHAAAALDYPYTLNYGEGPLLDQAVRLANGVDLYPPDLSAPPYTITNYPPLYILAQTPFLAEYGPAFWYGRLIALASAAAAAVLIALTIHALTRDALAALIGGALLLTIPYVLHWGPLARIDSLALALSWGGLFVIARWPERWAALLLAALLLTAAAYTRQTYLLAAPLAVFAWLIGRGRVYRGLVFAVLFGSLVLGIFAVLTVATRGGIFYHLITANVNALDPNLITFYADEIANHLPIFVVGGGLLIISGLIFALGRVIWRRRFPQAQVWWLAAPYLIGAALAALTISKVGSDINYLFEVVAACCLTAGLWVAWLRRWPPLRAAVMALIAVQVVMATALSEARYYPILIERTREDRRAQVAELMQTITTAAGPILADEHMGLLALSGQPIQLQPFEMSQLAQAGLWDQAGFVAALERGDYPTVMLYQPYRNPGLRFERWTPEMLNQINASYRPALQTAETIVYTHIDR
ncbi:MAG: hypothetical protein GYB67_10730 [Chloroflexi bacterium]|nr:hypothetical protein [Chloroflexota bacterium]